MLEEAYQLKGFYQLGDKGQGETIGLIEYSLADRAAINTFDACIGAPLTVYYDPTAQPPTQPQSEAAADVEVVAAIAPKATVQLYESNQSGTGLGPWQLAVSGSAPGGLPDVISSSWTSCEPLTGLGVSYYETEEVLFEEAAAQGQTVLVATGDDGSEGCYSQSSSSQLAVDDPASAPYVTAVGGTASDTPTGPQYVWNSHGALTAACLDTGCAGNGASGGGASQIWPRPKYQPANLPVSPACAFGAQGCREIPDVSALAGDPYSQYCTICGNGGGWLGFGGTSLSAPSWGAVVLLSESLCPTKIGFLGPLLYSNPKSVSGPVVSGDNDLLGSNGGLYAASATGGYSMATGVGYLGGVNLASGALCGARSAALASGPPYVAPASSTSKTGASSGLSSSFPRSPTGTPARACTAPVDKALKGTPVALAASEWLGCAGYWALSQTGAVTAFGSAINFGSAPKLLSATAVAITPTPDYQGYWLLASNGQVFAMGDAGSFGSPYHLHPSSPMVGMAATPDGNGYWIVAANGVIYTYGDAKFYGSMAGRHLNAPIAGITAVPDGKGYWLVASDGGVFGFGAAFYYGSVTALASKIPDQGPIIGITTGPKANGYRLASSNGDVFSFGASFLGSEGSKPPPAPLTAIARSVDGEGYYVMDSDGQVYAFGDAPYLGNATS